ncbi:MAG: hypothetical protein AAFV33_22150, partial [Chloroflexota bacterium]
CVPSALRTIETADGNIIAEPLIVNKLASGKDLQKRVQRRSAPPYRHRASTNYKSAFYRL